MPYIKKDFVVSGMPEGVPFKKPSCYGQKQMRKIMEHEQSITFQLTGDQNEHRPVNNAEALNALRKVVDEEKVAAVMDGKAVIEESDLEVISIEMDEDEFQLLITDYKAYFAKEALTSLQANYDHLRPNHEGYILPVYTESSEPYWLFYYPGKKSDIERNEPQTKILGYWLDRTKEKLKYQVLLEKVSINHKNIIQGDDKTPFLALRKKVELRSESLVAVPECFNESILLCLKKQGFV